MSKIRVAVLMGGRSAEREVSLSTGRQALEALDRQKYDAFAVDPAHLGTAAAGSSMPEGPPADAFSGAMVPVQALLDPETRPDVALICLHGQYGEDGAIQGMLELLGIPYTGSGVLGSALAMNKTRAKEIFRFHGIPTPKWVALLGEAEAADYLKGVGPAAARLPLPVVVKPANQGSTIGTTIVQDEGELATALETALAYDEEVLIEEFVAGMEITAAVLGNRELQSLPLIEIVPSGGFYDYEAKYTPGATEEIVPARLSDEITRQALALGRRAHRALGCRGVSRVDMIVLAGEAQVLEVNTIPGMTPTSLLPRAAAAAGIEFPALLDRMIELALETSGGNAREAGATEDETDGTTTARESCGAGGGR